MQRFFDPSVIFEGRRRGGTDSYLRLQTILPLSVRDEMFSEMSWSFILLESNSLELQRHSTPSSYSCIDFVFERDSCVWVLLFFLSFSKIRTSSSSMMFHAVMFLLLTLWPHTALRVTLIQPFPLFMFINQTLGQ